MSKILPALLGFVILVTIASVIIRRPPVYEVGDVSSAGEGHVLRADESSGSARFDGASVPLPQYAPVGPIRPAKKDRLVKPLAGAVPVVNEATGDQPAVRPEDTKPSKKELKKQQKAAKKPITVPEARLALAFVGTDPEAEEFWQRTINDPTVPAEERKDLIEDLNEVGLDKKNVTLADVPLIMNRLNLIERIGPEAMDDVNAAAFMEAHKDLTKMLNKLGQQ